ncbi:MFS transporter [Halorubrum gandharaense]
MDDNDRRIVSFTAVAHGLVHTYELSIPILMTVWLVEFSVSAAVLGALVTVGYGLFGVGALPGGVLVDRFGSKPLILACLVGMAVSFVLAAGAPNIYVLAAAIALWGATASVYHPAGLALLSKSVANPGTALGYHGMGGNVGIAFGPLATAVLLLWFDWRAVAVALTLPAIVVVAYGLLIEFEEGGGAFDAEDAGGTKGQVSAASIVSDTKVLLTLGFVLVLMVVTFNGLYYRAFLTFLPDLLGDVLDGLVTIEIFDPDSPYAEEFDVARYFYVAILTVGVAGQFIGGKLADRLPTERGLTLMLGVMAALALAFVPATATVPSFVVVSLLLGVALFSIQPLSQATVAAYSPPEARGLSFGYTYLAIFGVGALGASLAGVVLTLGTFDHLFLVLAALAGAGSVTSVVLYEFGERRS